MGIGFDAEQMKRLQKWLETLRKGGCGEKTGDKEGKEGNQTAKTRGFAAVPRKGHRGRTGKVRPAMHLRHQRARRVAANLDKVTGIA